MSTQGCSLSAWHAHSILLELGRRTAGGCPEGSLHAVDHSGSPASMPGYHHIMLAFKRTSLLGWSTLKVHCMRWVVLVAPPACQYTTTTHWPSRERVISHTHRSRADASHRSGLLWLANDSPGVAPLHLICCCCVCVASLCSTLALHQDPPAALLHIWFTGNTKQTRHNCSPSLSRAACML